MSRDDERKSWAETVWETAMKAVDPANTNGRKWLRIMESRLNEARERRLAKARQNRQKSQGE